MQSFSREKHSILEWSNVCISPKEVFVLQNLDSCRMQFVFKNIRSLLVGNPIGSRSPGDNSIISDDQEYAK